MTDTANLKARVDQHDNEFKWIKSEISSMGKDMSGIRAEIPRAMQEVAKQVITAVGERRGGIPARESNSNATPFWMGLVVTLGASLIGLAINAQIDSIQKLSAEADRRFDQHRSSQEAMWESIQDNKERSIETKIRMEIYEDRMKYWEQTDFFNSARNNGAISRLDERVKALQMKGGGQ